MMTPDYRPLTITRYRRRKSGMKRWAVWAAVVVMTPALGMAAYAPSALLSVNNLSDIASAVTARANLGLGTAATQASSFFLQAANNLSDLASAATARTNLGVPATTVTIATTAPLAGGGDLSGNRTLSLTDCNATTKGGVPTPPNNTTTFLRGDCTFAAPGSAAPVAPTIYTGASPVTLAATHNLLEVIEMATPAALTINLPASPSAGIIVCVKDGLKNFAANIATVKTTDSSTIDKVAGATGFPMNQNGIANCFQYAASGTNWLVM